MTKSTEAIYAGVRRFECDECGHKWDEVSRCYFSPSSECCDLCADYTSPYLGLKVRGIFFNSTGGVNYQDVTAAAIEQYPNESFDFG